MKGLELGSEEPGCKGGRPPKLAGLDGDDEKGVMEEELPGRAGEELKEGKGRGGRPRRRSGKVVSLT